MPKRTTPELKELFKQAADIAQQVPESIREAAFNRALDLLTGVVRSDSSSTQTKPLGKHGAQTPQGRIGASQQDLNVAQLIDAIDSTQYPRLTSASKVLDRSLMVLKIARADHNVDGLTSSEIAKILTEKFRISTTYAAVGMALGKVTNLVNRIQRGQGYAYRIMGPGEEYLTHLEKDPETKPSFRQKTRKRQKSVLIATKTKSAGSEPDQIDNHVKQASGGKSPRKPRPATNRKASPRRSIGPKAALIALVDAGFFSEGRTGPEVQSYLKTKRGLDFGTAQIRLAMLRLVRDLVLDRDENAEGQYEYKTRKS